MNYFCVDKCLANVVLHCGLLVFASTSFSLDITVITSDSKPVHIGGYRENIQYLNLDAVSTIENQLAKGLPVSEQEALAIIKKRITEIGQERLNAQIASAYQAIFTSLRHSIDRYPAIVFDNRFVVFGIDDLDDAIRKYQLHQIKGVIDE